MQYSLTLAWWLLERKGSLGLSQNSSTDQAKTKTSGPDIKHIYISPQEKYKKELKIQIEWRQPEVGPIDSPLNSSFPGMLSRHQISDEYYK